MNGLVFASYRFLLKLQLRTPDTVPTIAQIALAGAGCGIISSYVCSCVEDSRKIRLLPPNQNYNYPNGTYQDQATIPAYSNNCTPGSISDTPRKWTSWPVSWNCSDCVTRLRLRCIFCCCESFTIYLLCDNHSN